MQRVLAGAVCVLCAGWAAEVRAQGGPTDVPQKAGLNASDWTSPTLGKMRWVAPGAFVMGSPTSEAARGSDETQHWVAVTNGFLLMEHEVTQGEWKAVMGTNPSNFSACGDTCPVEQVTWDDIQMFIQKVSVRDGVQYRLPTEAEWEYAARGNQSYVYAGSDEIGAVAWYSGNSDDTTHPVCQKQRNGYGLCDMTGNVWERVQDWYGTYPGDTSDYVNAVSSSLRVVRGGDWSYDAEDARVANRHRHAPGFRSYALGFRLARSP